jgi:hypothetical protein
MWLLACAVFYQGGVAVAITLAAIYAESVIGFQQQETMVLIFVLNLAAAGGAFAWGYLQDRIGHKIALGSTLVGWIATCIIAALSTTKGQFWWAAAIAGLCMGSSQSAGPRHGGHVRAAAAARRVLRPVDVRDAPVEHHRPADLRRDHLGHRRQPAAGHHEHRGPLRRRPGAAVQGGRGAAAAPAALAGP